MFSGARFGGMGCAELPDAMSGTMREAGSVALVTEPVAEAGDTEGFAELRHKIKSDGRSACIQNFAEFWHDWDGQQFRFRRWFIVTVTARSPRICSRLAASPHQSSSLRSVFVAPFW
jgi:hypothetical protein